MENDRQIGQVADWLDQGYLSLSEIRDRLVGSGLAESDAYLTFVAGRLIWIQRERERDVI
jgi:hypothetical protein